MHDTPDRHYYTYKKEVTLKHGEYIGYTRGKGYYAHPATSKATHHVAKRVKKHAKVVSHAKLVKAKVHHKVALTAKKKQAAKMKMVVAFMEWAIAHSHQIHYAEIRPMPQVKFGKLPKLPFTTDCSGLATMGRQYAGLPDPNHSNGKYDGTGYTGTLLHGHRVPNALPGRIGVYGDPPGHHAVTALEKGSDPWVCSHGSEIGPLKIKASVEQMYQPHPLTWLA